MPHVYPLIEAAVNELPPDPMVEELFDDYVEFYRGPARWACIIRQLVKAAALALEIGAPFVVFSVVRWFGMRDPVPLILGRRQARPFRRPCPGP